MANGDSNTYVRRCHICGAITEQHQKIEHCTNCGRAMSPYFYFDENRTVIYSEALLRPPVLSNEYLPLLGFSTIWKG